MTVGNFAVNSNENVDVIGKHAVTFGVYLLIMCKSPSKLQDYDNWCKFI